MSNDNDVFHKWVDECLSHGGFSVRVAPPDTVNHWGGGIVQTVDVHTLALERQVRELKEQLERQTQQFEAQLERQRKQVESELERQKDFFSRLLQHELDEFRKALDKLHAAPRSPNEPSPSSPALSANVVALTGTCTLLRERVKELEIANATLRSVIGERLAWTPSAAAKDGAKRTTTDDDGK